MKKKRPSQVLFQVVKTDAKSGHNIKLRRLFSTEDEANKFAREKIHPPDKYFIRQVHSYD